MADLASTGQDLTRNPMYVWRNTVIDLRHRYAGAGLGLAWFAILPLVQIAVYSAVFSGIIRITVPELGGHPLAFTVYLCAGLLPWIGFAEIVGRCTEALVGGARFVTRLAVPEQVLFLRAAGTGVVSMFVGVGLLFVGAAAIGYAPALAWLVVPGILVLFSAFGLGLGMVAGVLHVFSRDVGQIVGIALQLSLWSVPIVYAESMVSEFVLGLIQWNPLHAYVASLHDAIVFRTIPEPGAWGWMAGLAVGSVVLGHAVVRRARFLVRDCL